MLVDDIKVYYNEDNTVNYVVAATQILVRNTKVTRITKIHIGKEYVVSPVHPQKLKHRGRKGIVVGFEKGEWEPIKAKLQFHDTNRVGKIDVRELEMIS